MTHHVEQFSGGPGERVDKIVEWMEESNSSRFRRKAELTKPTDEEYSRFFDHHYRYERDNETLPLSWYVGVSASFPLHASEEAESALRDLGIPYMITETFNDSLGGIGEDEGQYGWPYDKRWDGPRTNGMRWALIPCSSGFETESVGALLLGTGAFVRVHPYPIPAELGDGSATMHLGATSRSTFFPQIIRKSKIEDAHPVVQSFLQRYFDSFGHNAQVQLTSTNRLGLNYKISEIRNFIFPRKELWEEVNLSIDFDPAFGEDSLYVEVDMSGAFASAHGSRSKAPSPSKFQRLAWDARELQNGVERFATAFKREFHTSNDND